MAIYEGLQRIKRKGGKKKREEKNDVMMIYFILFCDVFILICNVMMLFVIHIMFFFSHMCCVMKLFFLCVLLYDEILAQAIMARVCVSIPFVFPTRSFSNGSGV